MPDYAERMASAKAAIDKARASGIPVIFIQEVHRPNMVDFGRELDGDEDVHCLEDDPNTAIADVIATIQNLSANISVLAANGTLSSEQVQSIVDRLFPLVRALGGGP